MSPASDGSNGLLVEGCNVATSAEDVLSYLDLVSPHTRPQGSDARETSGKESGLEDVQRLPQGASPDLLRAVVSQAAAGPIHIDKLVVELGIHPAQLLGYLRRFEQEGHISVDGSTVCLPGL